MSNKILIGTIAVLVLGIGAFALLSNKTNNQAAVSVSSTPTPTITSSPTASATPSAKMQERNVNVTANGFVPQTLKINAGTKVTWTNKSGVDRKSTRLNSSHQIISYAVFCLKKKKKNTK